MQRYHRIRHRVLWLLLAPLLVAILLYGIWSRPQWPMMDELPDPETPVETVAP